MTGETVATAVERLVAQCELDGAGQARAAVALTLARRLDEAAEQQSAAMTMALASVARELSRTLAALTEHTGAAAAFVAGLFDADE